MSKIIHVLDKRVALSQHEGGFQTSIDAVLLAAACPAKDGEAVLDLGCGVGSASLCLLKRVEGAQLHGIDIQSDAISIAQDNAAQNDMAMRARFEQADVRDFKRLEFNHVICNPPYLEAGGHVPSPSGAKATAMGFIDADVDLNDWVACAFDCIKGQGSLSMVHRADHIDDIIRAFGKRFGGIEIIPLWPKSGADAKRVIVRARKHSKAAAKIHAGLIIHKEDGKYTDEAEEILRGMSAI